MCLWVQFEFGTFTCNLFNAHEVQGITYTTVFNYQIPLMKLHDPKAPNYT